MDFSNAVVNGIPLVLVVIGLVEWLKRLNVSGAALNVASMLIGLGLGVAYWYAQAPLVSFGDWFGAAVYGVALGLVASGVYDAAKGLVSG